MLLLLLLFFLLLVLVQCGLSRDLDEVVVSTWGYLSSIYQVPVSSAYVVSNAYRPCMYVGGRYR